MAQSLHPKKQEFVKSVSDSKNLPTYAEISAELSNVKKDSLPSGSISDIYKTKNRSEELSRSAVI